MAANDNIPTSVILGLLPVELAASGGDLGNLKGRCSNPIVDSITISISYNKSVLGRSRLAVHGQLDGRLGRAVHVLVDNRLGSVEKRIFFLQIICCPRGFEPVKSLRSMTVSSVYDWVFTDCNTGSESRETYTKTKIPRRTGSGRTVPAPRS